MKRKVITIVLLSILITLTLCGTVGVAFADEVNIALLSYRSENISQEEIDFALSNLQFKLEKDLPRLIKVEEIYDFNEHPLYCLYEFDDYYMIVIRSTGSVLENDGIKYYGGYGEYYICRDEEYISILSEETAEQSKVIEMQSRMQVMRDLDYNDYIEAISTPMPLGAENRHRITKLGKNISEIIEFIYGSPDYFYNYFAQEINIDYNLKHNLNNINYVTKNYALYTIQGWDYKDNYGTAYYKEFEDNFYDFLYPQNCYNSCSIVAMTILLQFYDRLNIINLLSEDLYDIKYDDYNLNAIKNDPMTSMAEAIQKKLRNYIKVLSTNHSETDGAATYVNIDAGFERYFDDYGIDCSSTHFTSYTNIKSSVDDGYPSIMTIIGGRGFDINNIEQDLSKHNVVVYGYTTNSIGVMDEFVCHSGWHKTSGKNKAECAKLFVNKFYAAGNLHLTY